MSPSVDSTSGRHVCCFSDSEEDRVAQVAGLLSVGLEHGAKVIYLTDRLGRAEVVAQLTAAGIDAEALLGGGCLDMVLASSFNSERMALDPERAVSLVRSAGESSRELGFGSPFVVFEATWLTAALSRGEAYLDFERRLDEVAFRFRKSLFCLYELDRLDREELLDVLAAHREVLVEGRPTVNPLYLGADAPTEGLTASARGRGLLEVLRAGALCRPFEPDVDQLLRVPSEIDDLTRREREVLICLAAGARTRHIGISLGISPKTVETHRRHIVEKTGINSVAGLTKLALRAGLASLLEE